MDVLALVALAGLGGLAGCAVRPMGELRVAPPTGQWPFLAPPGAVLAAWEDVAVGEGLAIAWRGPYALGMEASHPNGRTLERVVVVVEEAPGGGSLALVTVDTERMGGSEQRAAGLVAQVMREVRR
jgi:hypothetical protein